MRINMRIFQYREVYLINLPEGVRKYEWKHVAVIKQNQRKQFDCLILNICCVGGQNITT